MSAMTESFSGSEGFPGIVHGPAYEARGISKKRQQLTKISRVIGLSEYRLYAVIQYNNIIDRNRLITGYVVSWFRGIKFSRHFIFANSVDSRNSRKLNARENFMFYSIVCVYFMIL